MRLLQLLTLALLATAARGDLSLTGTVSIFGPDGLLFHSDSECSGFGGASVFALCSAGFSDGQLILSLEASGDGTFGAENTALATFTDRITFYGPPGGKAAVTWFIEHGDSAGQVGLFDLVLPTMIQFNTPYDILLSLSGFETAFGSLSNSDSNSETIEGFLLFDTSNPVCSAITLGVPSDGADPSCGPAIFASVQTQSGFLYGGTAVPEPSSLLLLATSVGIASCVRRRRRRYAG